MASPIRQVGTPPSWLRRGLAELTVEQLLSGARQVLICPDAHAEFTTEFKAARIGGWRVRVVAEDAVSDELAALAVTGECDVLPRVPCGERLAPLLAARFALAVPVLLRMRALASAPITARVISVARASGFSLTVKEISVALGVCPRTLERDVKAELGTTPHEMLDGLRNELCNFLLMSGLQATTVARQLRYGHVQNLHRAVRRRHGVTPSQHGARLRIAAIQGQPLAGAVLAAPVESVPKGPDSPPHPVSPAR